MDQPIQAQPPTAPPSPAAPVPAQPAAPGPPQPPVGPPVTTMEDGGAIEKIDWVGWTMLGVCLATVGLIFYVFIKKAKESKELAYSQKGLESEVADLKSKILRPAGPYGGLGY